MTQNLEPGAASILIELRDGGLIVRHGTMDGLVLAEMKAAPYGTWNNLWDALARLGVKRVPMPAGMED